MKQNLVEKNWDYSLHAESYRFRPNYSDKVIDMLIQYMDVKGPVADIGAGTGNLTTMLLDRGLRVFAVEPNDEMRKIGIERTKPSENVTWVKAAGTETRLKDRSVQWVTFGSSFNVMDRDAGLQETHRILKTGGFFSCMWNHRDLNDPIQDIAERTILEFVPDYDRGVRREDQRPVIERNKDLFGNILYLELDFDVDRTIDTYINAWRSVKNKYWDLSSTEGRDLFERIMNRMRERLPERFKIQYTTRAWTAQKKD